jgi:hypothetical protein
MLSIIREIEKNQTMNYINDQIDHII